jgi:ribosome-associated protein
MTGRNRALRIVERILEKKGEDVLLLDLRRASPVADFFVLVTAQSPLHAQAIADHVAQNLKRANSPVEHVEGQASGQWILLDFVDVVVHIFLPDVRAFYGLERLWGDMPQQRFADNPGKPGRTP